MIWIFKYFKPWYLATNMQLCYGGHFNHRLYITYTLQAPKREETEYHGRQIALQRNADNRTPELTLTLNRHLTSLCGKKNLHTSFSFSPYSFLGCDMKGMKKSQAQIFPANTLSDYTDNHSSFCWRSLSSAIYILAWGQALNTLSVINTLPFKYVYEVSHNRIVEPLGLLGLLDRLFTL